MSDAEALQGALEVAALAGTFYFTVVPSSTYPKWVIDVYAEPLGNILALLVLAGAYRYRSSQPRLAMLAVLNLVLLHVDYNVFVASK